ncbi:MAG: ATPase, T2SS/T4P/T4SS family [Polyangiales bacterium]
MLTVPPIARGLEATLEHGGELLWTRPVVRGEQLRLGRAPQCEVVLESAAVSRVHATVRIDEDGLEVRDSSTNGTIVDGALLRQDSTRVPFDVPISLAGHVLTIRLRAASTEPVQVEVLPESGAPIELRREVHRMLLEHLDMNAIDPTRSDDPTLRPRVLAALRRIARMLEATLPSGLSLDALVGEVSDEALGLGPLERLLADPEVSEIMVIDAHHIFVERNGKLVLSGARFTDEERMRAAIERIVTPLGRRIDESSPLVDARLPDGSRVNVVIRPLALRGSCITIRKFARSRITLDKLLGYGSLSPAMARFLERSVRAKKNIVISGGTGSGKTTLLNVLSSAIPEQERIVTIEDAAELQLSQPHVVSLESRPANMEGKGEVAIRELVKNALRMRPDRIVVGECRGGEALDMLQAMNTGHDGSLTTTHANSPAEALARLETLALMANVALPSRAIREQLAKSIHLIVQQSRLGDGSRRVTAISEVAGMDAQGNLRLRPLFEFLRSGTGPGGRVLGEYAPTGYLPSFLPELMVLGLLGAEEELV